MPLLAPVVLAALRLEEHHLGRAALVDDLPLFAVQMRKPAPAAAQVAGLDELRETLAGLDPDEMTPREALEALYKLKRLS